MFCALKKTIGVCFVGVGLGVLLVLLLPTVGWLILAMGIMWLFC